MGQLIEGVWKNEWYEADDAGRFIRPETQFRCAITGDGKERWISAEPGRYHLYISLACPWAHRALIMRKLKKLEQAISISIVDYYMGDNGWTFTDAPGCIPDTVNHKKFLYEIYTKASPEYSGRVTVPVLWDKKENNILCNESSEIMRMLDTQLDSLGDATVNFYPEHLREEVDRVCEAIYGPINDGVYRAGFATTQQAYEEAVTELFSALDHWEKVLACQRYLCGEVITEADWRLFATLIRFDSVYVSHFKCNIRRIIDYPNLWNYLKELFQYPGVSETCDFTHIKGHYFKSHAMINPTGIVPKGPVIDFNGPHDRERL